MKRIQIISLLATALMLTACGGGGGQAPPQGGDPNALVNQGVGTVNQMLSDAAPVNVANLTAANNSFSQARALAPTNRNANGGYAITKVALEVQKVLDLLGIQTNSPGANPTLLEQRLSAARFGMLGNLTPAQSVSNVLPIDTSGQLNLAVFRGGLTSRAYPENPSYTQIYNALKAADTQIALAEQVLANESVLPSDTAPMVFVDPGNPANSVKVGTTEIRALRAAVSAVRSILNLLLAYDFGFDPATYLYNSPFVDVFPGNLDGSPIAPANYLPGGNFGKLHTDGEQRLAQFLASAKLSAQASLDATSAYKARTGTGFVLDPGASASGIADFEAAVQDLQGYLNGPKAINNGNLNTTLNLPAWVAAPPADLRLLAPPISVIDNGTDLLTNIQGDTYPDRTFGGLFSPGLPADMLFSGATMSRNAPLYEVVILGF